MTNPLPARILVVDDTRANIRLLSTLLDRQGYTVQFALDGTKALASIEKKAPDLILLDVEMPGMSGYEVCERIKAKPETQDIPVIFISARSEVVDKVRGFEVGGVDYVTKPFQVEEVLARVDTHLKLRNLQRALQETNDQLQQDMAYAYQIQRGLLADPEPAWPELDVVCYNAPALELGGDFYAYHIFPTSEAAPYNRYAVAIGDVSGKGVAAALLMATALSQFDASLDQPFTADERFYHLDKALLPYTQPSGQNCALVYIELSLWSRPEAHAEVGRLRSINAGCIPPFLYHAGQVKWLDVVGLPLGMDLGLEFGYNDVEVKLDAGDFIILTSDGCVEAFNADFEMFGFERLEQAIASGPNHSAKAMLDHLLESVTTFTGETELSDDLTIVVIKV
ncbi:MAG: SpoIIE family protein phosphatase [Chloroflexota bacterium]